MSKLFFTETLEDFLKKAEHFPVIVVPAPKKDDARVFCMAYSEELGEIEVCCDHNTVLLVCLINDL